MLGISTFTPEVTRALEFAVMSHLGQTRKLSGAPYVQHCIQVACDAASAGLSEPCIIAALLHDTVEDTPVTITEIREEFGAEVASLVGYLTKNWTKQDLRSGPGSYEDRERHFKYLYYREMAQSSGNAIALKLIDRTRNLADMVRDFDKSPDWSTDYYFKTLDEFGTLLESELCYHEDVIERFALEVCRLYLKVCKHVGDTDMHTVPRPETLFNLSKYTDDDRRVDEHLWYLDVNYLIRMVGDE